MMPLRLSLEHLSQNGCGRFQPQPKFCLLAREGHEQAETRTRDQENVHHITPQNDYLD